MYCMTDVDDAAECKTCKTEYDKWEPKKPEPNKREQEEADRKMMAEINRILANKGRPTMLGKPLPNYERADSRIPEQIRVSFSDGTTAIYDLRVEQPAPFVESIRIIRKWKQGYVNKPMRRRNKR